MSKEVLGWKEINEYKAYQSTHVCIPIEEFKQILATLEFYRSPRKGPTEDCLYVAQQRIKRLKRQLRGFSKDFEAMTRRTNNAFSAVRDALKDSEEEKEDEH